MFYWDSTSDHVLIGTSKQRGIVSGFDDSSVLKIITVKQPNERNVNGRESIEPRITNPYLRKICQNDGAVQ